MIGRSSLAILLIAVMLGTQVGCAPHAPPAPGQRPPPPFLAGADRVGVASAWRLAAPDLSRPATGWRAAGAGAGVGAAVPIVGGVAIASLGADGSRRAS